MSSVGTAAFQSNLGELLTQFIVEKRACGYRYREESRALLAFDAYLHKVGHESMDLPRDVVEVWTCRSANETPRNHEHRQRLVQQFGRFLASRGFTVYLPDTRGRARARASFVPYIFTRDEIVRLLTAAEHLPTSTLAPHRHVVVPEVFQLLCCCGLRLGEALHLRRFDVDLDQGVLTIRDGKFQKDRLVPLPAVAHARLKSYCDRVGMRRADSAFFPGPYGAPYSNHGMYKIFRRLLRDSGIPHGGRGRGPRIHDLRHSFAVHRLEAWYREGADLDAKLPLLATYLGHRGLQGTQIYLRLTPQLFPDVSSRLEDHVGHIIPGGATMKPTDLAVHLSAFLGSYMPAQRGASPHTIKTYRDAFMLLLRYMRDQRGRPAEKLTIDEIDAPCILGFLDHLKMERQCQPKSCNQRLAAIHAFFRYVQIEEPARIAHCQRVLAIPVRRSTQESVSYLSAEDVAAILRQPDRRSAAGRRDAALLSLLYDTGARVQELADLRVRDVRIDAPSHVRLLGKGRKFRTVPLLSATATLIHDYIEEHRLDRPERHDGPLFFNRRAEALSRFGIRYILQKYVEQARPEQPGLATSVSPHTMRHTKAMHLLQAGNPAIIIRDILGHSDIKTTTVYARADLEAKRRALEKTSRDASATSTASWRTNPTLMDWLRNL